MRTVVIGSGSWGTALAQVLQDNHQEVLVYGVAEAEVNDINENHKNSKYFGDVELNPELKATTDIQCIKGPILYCWQYQQSQLIQFVTKSMIY